MKTPRTREDLENLIVDQVQENARLEYKDSRALDFSGSSKHKAEFAKDVSAMANSDGGVIIYGIVENDHIPTALDEGIAHEGRTRERLEDLIVGNIRPRPRFEIIPIPVSDDKSAFVVAIERSDRPHQNTIDKRYYKRFNFSAHPMEDYEIEDVRGRRLVSEPEVSIAMEAGGHVVYFVVENMSKRTALDVSFQFPDELRPWLEKNKAPSLIRGVRSLPPGRRLRFFYGAYIPLIAEDSPLPKQFDLSVSYRTEAGQVKTETLHVDLMDYFGSQVERTEIERVGETISKGLEALTKQVERLAGFLDQHVGPMSTASGLTLSATALRNLRHVLTGSDEIEKVHPTDFSVVQEILQIDRSLAIRIWEFLQWSHDGATLETLEGVDAELADRIRARLIIDRND
jgi:hypothetical protein